MNRRDYIKIVLSALGSFFVQKIANANPLLNSTFKLFTDFSKKDFGIDFLWGIAAASQQTEGLGDKKGESIWDRFSHTSGKIFQNQNSDVATDFFHRYEEDILLIKKMNFKIFRFSIAWSRIIPDGENEINSEGILFYHKVIDCCINNGIEPWITLYHWDLPQKLEDKGGWTNRKIINWFTNYVDICTKEYGAKVKTWLVLNEPFAFTGLGYMLGIHAPGKKGLNNFLPAVLHTVLAQAEGARKIRKNIPLAKIGTTYSVSPVDSLNNKTSNTNAAKFMDAVFNRLFIEPALGLGFPYSEAPILRKIEKYMQEGDIEKFAFDFDFIGLQYYTRAVVKKGLILPKLISPKKINAIQITEMNQEVYPEGMYRILKQFAEYKNVKQIIITENGVCFPDALEGEKVHDCARIQYFKEHLAAVLKAKKEGINIGGYLVWSPTDNFEWAEGFRPRFGLVYIDYQTLNRYIKDSGLWFRAFLAE